MTAAYRQTAAAWHGGRSSRLYAYASTGAVLAGLEGEIRDCLAIIESGKLDIDLDAVDEHQRLTALLHHVQPDRAKDRAERAGRRHGRTAAAWWQQEALGGHATGDTAATARRVLQGIEDGDPVVLDSAPGWDQIVSASEVMTEAEWPEPHVDDRESHRRWEAAQPGVCDAYASGFVDAFWKAVAKTCRNEFGDTITDAHPPAAPDEPRVPETVGAAATGAKPIGLTRPYLRLVATRSVDIPGTPPGWVSQPIGRWQGLESEVVYDPRRVDVAVTSSRKTSVAASFETSGWEQQETDGHRRLWVRDRVAATRSDLARAGEPGPSAGLDPAPTTVREVTL